jgi:cyanamide hydratase
MSTPPNSFGWVAIPRSMDKLIANVQPDNSLPVNATSVPLPNTPLSTKTLSHSLRVYVYGHAIVTQHFPELLTPTFLETYYLSCLLHDIGTSSENLNGTKMSFDFYGAIVALEVLKEFGAEKEQAEAVAEAIIRHQDLGVTGTITSIGGIIQLATILGEQPRVREAIFERRANLIEPDNVGLHPELVHKETIISVTDKYPRNKWTSCFAATVREELALKPWAHSTHIDHFIENVEGNTLMEPYD